jgi:hypothetical protein
MSRSHSNSNHAVTPSPVAPVSTTPVATPIPSDVIAQCIALLEQVDALIGPVTPLSADAIHRSLKRRKGAAQVVTDLVALCHQHGVTSVGRVSVEQMSSSMSRATALETIGVQLAATHKMLDDATFSAWSNAWQNATTLYTILQRLALNDPTLALGLKPVQAFFKTKRTKGAKRATSDEEMAEKEPKDAVKPASTDGGVATATKGGAAPAPA